MARFGALGSLGVASWARTVQCVFGGRVKRGPAHAACRTSQAFLLTRNVVRGWCPSLRLLQVLLLSETRVQALWRVPRPALMRAAGLQWGALTVLLHTASQVRGSACLRVRLNAGPQMSRSTSRQ